MTVTSATKTSTNAQAEVGFDKKACHTDPLFGLPRIPNLWLSSWWAAKNAIERLPDVVVPLDSVTGGIWATLPPWRGRLIYLPIDDYKSLPLDVLETYVGLLCGLLQDGNTVHVFCVGGHGRTGYVASAIVGKLLPDVEDPVQYVRDNYCQNAVESQEQLDSLADFLGKPALKSKKTKEFGFWGYSGYGGAYYDDLHEGTCWHCDHFKTSLPTSCKLSGEKRSGDAEICERFIHWKTFENYAEYTRKLKIKPDSTVNMCSLTNTAASPPDEACEMYSEVLAASYEKRWCVYYYSEAYGTYERCLLGIDVQKCVPAKCRHFPGGLSGKVDDID